MTLAQPSGNPSPTLPDGLPSDNLTALVDALIQSRQHIGPKHLDEPGPSPSELDQLFTAAAAAPDHEQLRPWRFLVLGPQARHQLADAFEEALLERDATAQPHQREDARVKAFRGPVLVMVVADLRAPNEDVPDAERLVSLGAAIQNFCLAALARGYATGLTSGRALRSTPLRNRFAITQGEEAVCFITVGTPRKSRPKKARPQPQEFVNWLP